MKIIALFFFFLTIVAGFPVTSPNTRVTVRDDPLTPKPVHGRPVTGRSIEPRPVESREVAARQEAVPNSYIIEIKNGYTHDDFRGYLDKEAVAYKFTSEWKQPKLFFGVAIELEDEQDYPKVKAWEGVKTISPNHIVTVPTPPTIDPVVPAQE
ncbi:hypothetical protein BDV95DRAFT_603733 [Massariosphaeria phaeospora]|uniref:Inhibitor I9 domain-containing protein n=1 Tax=Massariosphaeria phaeospora TaxID=100035 RepID=A0A7C8IFE6_9PLEO|nr:hypothetical protein BDV95DRAFT_603733 [Massariosphaeria phaeospora]